MAKIKLTYSDSSLLHQTMTTEGYKYVYIYIKLYRTIGRIKIFEKILDRLFVAKKTHKIQMFLYPVSLFLTYPTLAIYRVMMKISPKITRKIKKIIIGRE